jgi:hypothetical protein
MEASNEELLEPSDNIEPSKDTIFSMEEPIDVPRAYNGSSNMKKIWSDQDIIRLGYVPDEVLVKFKEDRIDLSTKNGSNQANEFFRRKADELSPKIISRLKRDEKKSRNFDAISISEKKVLEDGFFEEKEQLKFANASVLKLKMDEAVMETIEELKNNPDIEYAIPNYVFEFHSTINDPEYIGGNQ